MSQAVALDGNKAGIHISRTCSSVILCCMPMASAIMSLYRRFDIVFPAAAAEAPCSCRHSRRQGQNIKLLVLLQLPPDQKRTRSAHSHGRRGRLTKQLVNAPRSSLTAWYEHRHVHALLDGKARSAGRSDSESRSRRRHIPRSDSPPRRRTAHNSPSAVLKRLRLRQEAHLLQRVCRKRIPFRPKRP